MAEWLSYSLEDFLLFSASAYLRLFERFNEDYGLFNGIAWVLMATLAASLWSRHWSPQHRRLLCLALGLVWLYSGAMFFWVYFREINWAAVYPAWAFFLQALLFLPLAWRLPTQPRPRLRIVAGILIAGLLFLYPLMAPSASGWSSAGFAGSAPDPTAAATLLFLACLDWRGQRWLACIVMLIPTAWLILSALGLYAMELDAPWLLAAVVALALSMLWMPAGRERVPVV